MPTSTTSSQPNQDHPLKRQRVLELLTGDDVVWLTSPAAVSWYLGGARVHTSLVGPPIAGVLVGHGVEEVVTYSNEADRLVAEELPAGIGVATVPWHTPLDEVAAQAVGDRLRPERDLEAQLRAARASLLPQELGRFEALCAETAGVLTRRLSAFDPSATERELGALITHDVFQLGADPVVAMVAGSARLPFRHPLVTDAPVGERAMAVVCARRHGMIANITRWVRSAQAPAEEAEAEARLMQVEAAYFAATRAGHSLAEVLAAGAAAYAENGFAADEWERHHQGGAAGYAGRDPRATAGTPDVVQNRQLFAWNPSAPGQKLEDTVILDDCVLRPLTVDPAWPTVTVNGIERPATLEV